MRKERNERSAREREREERERQIQTKMSKAFQEIFSTINSRLAASCPKYGKLFIDESDLGIDTAMGGMSTKERGGGPCYGLP